MNIFRQIKRLFGVRESIDPTSIYGVPVDFERLYSFGRNWPTAPLYGPETRPERHSVLRSITDHNRARNLCRFLAESNPNASGLVERITDFAVGRGSDTEIHGLSEDPPKRLANAVKTFVERFKAANPWTAVEEEMLCRIIIDGEFFLRFFPDEDRITKVRFVEPSQIQPPMGESDSGPWSFGILTHSDATQPEAYCIHDHQTNEDELVEPQFILHGKAAFFGQQKRGVPMLWSALQELEGAARLRYVNREGEKARSAIAFIRQHALATRQTIEAIRSESYTDQVTRQDSNGGHDVFMQRVEPGSVQDIPEGLQFVNPPSSPNADATDKAIRQALESVAARFGVPSWIVTGSSDATNFAASLTAESPFVKSLERWQGRLATWSDTAQTVAVQIGAEQGELPDDVLERVDLLVSFPSPATRNKLEESQRRDLLNQRGIISASTWRTEEGYDEREAERIAQERQEGITPEGTTQQPQAPSGSPGARYAQQTGGA